MKLDLIGVLTYNYRLIGGTVMTLFLALIIILTGKLSLWWMVPALIIWIIHVMLGICRVQLLLQHFRSRTRIC